MRVRRATAATRTYSYSSTPHQYTIEYVDARAHAGVSAHIWNTDYYLRGSSALRAVKHSQHISNPPTIPSPLGVLRIRYKPSPSKGGAPSFGRRSTASWPPELHFPTVNVRLQQGNALSHTASGPWQVHGQFQRLVLAQVAATFAVERLSEHCFIFDR